MKNVLAPVEEPYSAEVAEILGNYPQQGGYILSLFRVFANSVRFLRKGVPNLLDKASPLPLRLREVVILRVTANRNCEYEWGVHVAAFSGPARLTDEQVIATRIGPSGARCWSMEESLLLRVVDELCANATLSDETLAGFQAAWTVEQQLEILALCGGYFTISLVANTARLKGEAFGATFPAPVAAQVG